MKNKQDISNDTEQYGEGESSRYDNSTEFDQYFQSLILGKAENK